MVCDAQHQLVEVVLGGSMQTEVVSIEMYQHCHKSSAFVAVDKRVIATNAERQGCGASQRLWILQGFTESRMLPIDGGLKSCLTSETHSADWIPSLRKIPDQDLMNPKDVVNRECL